MVVARFRCGDDVDEIYYGRMLNGAAVSLSPEEGPNSTLPQPLLEVYSRDKERRLTFIVYTGGIEVPFEAAQRLVHEPQRYLPPRADPASA